MREIVAGVLKQAVGAQPVAAGRLQRHRIADREPCGLEVDQCSVLVEQDPLDLAQAPTPR